MSITRRRSEPSNGATTSITAAVHRAPPTQGRVPGELSGPCWTGERHLSPHGKPTPESCVPHTLRPGQQSSGKTGHWCFADACAESDDWMNPVHSGSGVSGAGTARDAVVPRRSAHDPTVAHGAHLVVGSPFLWRSHDTCAPIVVAGCQASFTGRSVTGGDGRRAPYGTRRRDDSRRASRCEDQTPATSTQTACDGPHGGNRVNAVSVTCGSYPRRARATSSLVRTRTAPRT